MCYRNFTASKLIAISIFMKKNLNLNKTTFSLEFVSLRKNITPRYYSS